MGQSDTDQARSILHQEESLRLAHFGYDDAWRLGSSIVERARARSLAIATSIYLGDQTVFHAALSGTSPDNDAWLRRRGATVRRFHHASWLLELQARQVPDLHRVLGTEVHDYAFAGGAFPLRVGECMVGVVAVSGLTSEDDHGLVVEALEAHLDEESSGTW